MRRRDKQRARERGNNGKICFLLEKRVGNNRLAPNGVKQLRNQIKLEAIVELVFQAAFDNTLGLFIMNNGSFSLQVLGCFLPPSSFYSPVVSDGRGIFNNGLSTILPRSLCSH